MANGSNGTATVSISQAELDALIAERDALKQRAEARSQLSLKVGPSGGVSLSGVNSARPVTLYAEQWERVLAFAPNILAFITANEGLLDRKTDNEQQKLAKLVARDAKGIKRPEVAAAEYAARAAK
jgi:hypothetical protein